MTAFQTHLQNGYCNAPFASFLLRAQTTLKHVKLNKKFEVKLKS